MNTASDWFAPVVTAGFTALAGFIVVLVKGYVDASKQRTANEIALREQKMKEDAAAAQRARDDHERHMAREEQRRRFELLEAQTRKNVKMLETNTFKISEIASMLGGSRPGDLLTRPADLEGGG